MKKWLYTVAAFLCSSALMVQPLMAQNSDTAQSAYNEIIIRQKGLPQDVTIQLKGDEVWVNGKKLMNGTDSSITVLRRDVPLINGNNFAFNNFDNHHGFSAIPNYRNQPGVTITNENKALLGVVTEKATQGVRITMISDSSAAQKSGLQEGDVIEKIDDHEVKDPQNLAKIIGNYNPGDNISITYLRDNKTHTAQATLGKNDSENNALDMLGINPRIQHYFRMMPPGNGNGFNFFNNDDNRPKLGITIQDTQQGNGVKVLKVQPNSAAEKAGIKQGDIITAFGDNNVSNVNEMMQAIQDEKSSSSATVKLQRNNKTETLQITIPKNLHTMNL